ncbi:MAG: thymidine phosphorylase [Anaerovoracaceae bacterium]|jgi:pyrimidine-nucleoside phosphorylase
MSMLQIIYKKRDGGILTERDISYWIEGAVRGEVPDYQSAALLMAIYFRGLNRQETFLLTDVMRRSGDIVDLTSISGIKVDKHSSGGVGDKTTLITGPLVAACGVPVAKMSGRGLGFSGGTIDKLESIPGFRTTMTEKEFTDQINRVGLAVIGQTKNIAVADKMLYGLRDVTGTVENVSLIASSIMSKKLASGSDAIVLDVKWGRGAFMENPQDAAELGRLMVDIGGQAGKKMVALITNMDQPLGEAVGNSLEVVEAIDVLKGKGPEDIRELSLRLAAFMVYCGGRSKTPEDGYAMVKDVLDSGKGLDRFREFVKAQGGLTEIIEDSHCFGQPEKTVLLLAPQEGYITDVHGGLIGRASQMSGAGRQTMEDRIDPLAGIFLHKKKGDRVCKGDVLARVFGCEEKVERALLLIGEAFTIGGKNPEGDPLIYDIIM